MLVTITSKTARDSSRRPFMRGAFCCTAMAFTIALGVAPSASAAADYNIAILDVQKILSEGKAARSLAEQLQEAREGLSGEVRKAEEVLREELGKLEQGRDTLSKLAFEQQLQSLQEKGRSQAEDFRRREQALVFARESALTKIRVALAKVTQKLSDANNYDLVLRRLSVLRFKDKSLDITGAAMVELDKDLPDVELDLQAIERLQKKS